MKLKELDVLIERLTKDNNPSDFKLIQFYQDQREKLVKEIWTNMQKGWK